MWLLLSIPSGAVAVLRLQRILIRQQRDSTPYLAGTVLVHSDAFLAVREEKNNITKHIYSFFS